MSEPPSPAKKSSAIRLVILVTICLAAGIGVVVTIAGALAGAAYLLSGGTGFRHL